MIFRAFVLIWLVFPFPLLGAPETWTDPAAEIDFVSISKGCFEMGRNDRLEPPFNHAWTWLAYRGDLAFDESPRHKVCIDDFWLGKYEVRAREWQRVMGEPPPRGTGDMPASGITWLQAKAFLARLNGISEGRERYRLPTEAEWEYACLAGAKKDYMPTFEGADRVFDFAWHIDVGRQGHHLEAKPVGHKKSNVWGLHDMLGNVWEWVEDAYRADAYKNHVLYNPRVAVSGSSERVIRGGGHWSDYPQMRCANRSRYVASDTLDQIGMRIVREAR